jgi:hypothetical protein
MRETATNKPGIVIFGFNRPAHLRTLLESLESNDVKEYKIYVYVDGPRNLLDQENIRKVKTLLDVKRPYNFQKVYFHETNLGLAESIKYGINQVFIDHKSVIVLEDDLILHNSFIRYMAHALDKYQEHSNVGSVSGYHFAKFPFLFRDDVLLSLRHSSWGWGTWRDRWDEVDWGILNRGEFLLYRNIFRCLKIGIDYPGMILGFRRRKIRSWSIPFDTHCINRKLLCVHPRFQYVENLGFDGTGTNYLFTLKSKKITEKTYYSQLPKFPKFSPRYHLKIWVLSSPILRIIQYKTNNIRDDLRIKMVR